MLFKNLIAVSIAASLEITLPALAADRFANVPLPMPRPHFADDSKVRVRAAPPPDYIQDITETMREQDTAYERPLRVTEDLDLDLPALKRARGHVDEVYNGIVHAQLKRNFRGIAKYCRDVPNKTPDAVDLCNFFEGWRLGSPKEIHDGYRFTAPGIQARFWRAAVAIPG